MMEVNLKHKWSLYLILQLLVVCSPFRRADNVKIVIDYDTYDSLNYSIISRIDNIDTVLCGIFGNNANIQFDSISFSYLSDEKKSSIKKCLNESGGELVVVNNKHGDPDVCGLLLSVSDLKLVVSFLQDSEAGYGFQYHLDKNGEWYTVNINKYDHLIY